MTGMSFLYKLHSMSKSPRQSSDSNPMNSLLFNVSVKRAKMITITIDMSILKDPLTAHDPG